MQNEIDSISLIFFVIVLFAFVFSQYLYRKRRKNRAVHMRNTSVLLSYYTEGGNMTPIHKGKIGSLHYSSMVIMRHANELSGVPSAAIYRVELPFKTTVHILGVPKSSGVVQLNPASHRSIMEEVVLEGDYPNHFSLFAEKNYQMETRYVLDPKAMVFTIDFCKSHNWEIVGSTLYFLQAGDQNKDDPTSMYEDILKFIEEIRPAVEVKLTDKDIQLRTPYGEERRTLQCPICMQNLLNQNNLLICPKNHGLLTKGSELKKLEFTKNHRNTENDSGEKDEQRTLVCPGCKHDMTMTNYNGGTTWIDSCAHCPYRWLDVNEYRPLEEKIT